MQELTEDSIYRLDIRILQQKNGYRFAVDSVLLSHFIRTRESDRVLEVGAGSGVITILLSSMQKFRSGFAVEVQPELAELCRQNFKRNGIENVEIFEIDFNKLDLPSHSLDLIYSNPPYRKAGSGKLNHSEQKSIARHEIKMALEDLFRRSQDLLVDDGRLTMILPEYREKDFLRLVSKYSMHLIERQYVHSFAQEAPAFMLATVSRKQSKFHEHQRIVIYEKPGQYTEEMKQLLGVLAVI